MPNGRNNVTPVKNGIQLQKKLSKEERWPGRSRIGF
jgi:hypothetical protein